MLTRQHIGVTTRRTAATKLAQKRYSTCRFKETEGDGARVVPGEPTAHTAGSKTDAFISCLAQCQHIRLTTLVTFGEHEVADEFGVKSTDRTDVPVD